MAGPLEGVRVIDLTSMLSGPVATMMLGDQGADVIKVEPPTGDLVRHMGRGGGDMLNPAFLSCNRSKRSLCLDLKTEKHKEILRKLIKTADVFVQNFRPGAIERMGFGYEDVREIRPDIVYLSISGFGETGPYANKRVYDPVIQALCGLADVQKDRDTGRPRMVRTVIPDKTTALTAAQTITAALFARERTGKGQHVKLSMLDTMIAYLWPEGMAGLVMVGKEDKGSAGAQLSQDLIYKTADGYITCGAVSDSEWQGLCNVLEKPGWLTDERFATAGARVRNAPERLSLTAEILGTRPSSYWLKRLDEEDVPSAPVLKRHEMLDHEQILTNGILQEFEHDGLGQVRQARPAARFAETPAEIRRPAPQLGQHNEEILAELG